MDFLAPVLNALTTSQPKLLLSHLPLFRVLYRATQEYLRVVVHLSCLDADSLWCCGVVVLGFVNGVEGRL